jgi:hypothetical protein
VDGVPEPHWEQQDYLEATTPDQSVSDPWEIADSGQTEKTESEQPADPTKEHETALAQGPPIRPADEHGYATKSKAPSADHSVPVLDSIFDDPDR